MPPKIKIFAWKAVQQALPVAAALHKRNIIDSAMCSRCQNAWESIGHALFSCPHAKAVWKHTNLQLDFRRAYSMYKGDYIIHMAGLLDKSEFEVFICIMWSIWHSRNAVLHGHSVRAPSSQADYGRSYIAKYHSVTQQSHSRLQRQINTAGTSKQYNGQANPSMATTTAAINVPPAYNLPLSSPTQLNTNPSRGLKRPRFNDSPQNSTVQTGYFNGRNNASRDSRWVPPDLNMYKINVDAAANFTDLRSQAGRRSCNLQS